MLLFTADVSIQRRAHPLVSSQGEAFVNFPHLSFSIFLRFSFSSLSVCLSACLCLFFCLHVILSDLSNWYFSCKILSGPEGLFRQLLDYEMELHEEVCQHRDDLK